MLPDQAKTDEPLPTFDVLPLSAELRRAVDELGYVHPTPVQRAVFEPASRGRDLVVQARTGTGKTAAFAMPLIDARAPRSAPGVQALVLCPTRELALQVNREVEALGKYRGTKVTAVYGGAPMPRQIEAIQNGAQILVGTPGRVLDHLRRGTLDPSTIRVFVLDESDEMLSMGFLPQISEILGFLPESRQTLLFSATLPPDIRRVAETRLKSPEFLTLSGDHIGALEVQHTVYLSRGDKLSELIQVIEVENPESAIVFCNTKDETKRVSHALQQQGFAADWLNADLAQNDREKVMAATRKGELRFLVCTDVASRGIDISHLTHVINFDFPESAESYVHRTGRTGRAGRTGNAIALIEPGDIGNLYILKLTYKVKPIERQLPSAVEKKTRAESDLLRWFVDAFEKRTMHADDLALAKRLLTHEQAERIVAGLLRDHLGARPDAQDEATAARRTKPARIAPEPSEQRVERVERPRAERPERPARAERPAERAERPAERAERPAERAERPAERAERPAERAERPAERAERPAERAERPAERAERPAERERPERRERAERPERQRPPARLAPEPAAEAAPSRSNGHAAHIVVEEPAAPSLEDIENEQPTPPGCAEIYVSVGRRDGARPSDFQTILEKNGLGAEHTDYIRVRHRHAFVGVQPELADKAVLALNGATIAGKLAFAERARERI